MNLLVAFAALGNQQIGEMLPITLEDAETVLLRELNQHSTDLKLISAAPLMLLDLQEAGEITREHIDFVLKNIIRKHYLDPSSSLVPLSNGMHRVGISNSNMLRIFYLRHADQQDEGWSCGFRSVLSGAALQKELRAGVSLLSSQSIGRTCLTLRRDNPGLAGCIEYIRFRSKIDEVASLLRRTQAPLTRAITLLKEGNVDGLTVLLKIQPDYFLKNAAIDFLSSPELNLIDAIALLGKSSQYATRSICDELVSLLVAEFTNPTASAHLDTIFKELYDALHQVKAFITPELEKFKSWEADLTLHRHDLIRFVLTNYCPGMVALGRHVRAICRAHQSVSDSFERARSALEACAQHIDHSKIQVSLNLLRTESDERRAAVQEGICTIDKRIGQLVQVIKQCDCPKITSALALFHSGADFENDDIIDLLKRSKRADSGTALTHINEAQHTQIQTSITRLTELLNLLDKKDRLPRIRTDLDAELGKASSLVRETERELAQLRERLEKSSEHVSSLDQTLREARELFQRIDTQRIVEAFTILEPQYPPAATSVEQTTADLLILLEQQKDPVLEEVLDKLAVLQSDEEDSVMQAIEAIESVDTTDALELLYSNTATSKVRDTSKSAATEKRIAQINASSAHIGNCADPDNLIKLIHMPELGLSPENVHILGDFVREGLLFDPSDSILKGLSDNERDRIERSDTKVQQSERVIKAIAEHFKVNYVDTDMNGAHHFICNIKRPSEHWILVSLVKIKGKKPILVLLDSMNYEIIPDENPQRVGTDTVLAFLHTKFMR